MESVSETRTRCLEYASCSEILDLSVRERTPGLPGDERRQAATMMRELRDLYAADKATYINNYTARAKLIAHSHGIHAPVEVVAIHDHTDTREIARDPLTRELHRELVQGTVVPATGNAPAEHPGQKPADIAPSYLARADEHHTARVPAIIVRPVQITHHTGSGLSI